MNASFIWDVMNLVYQLEYIRNLTWFLEEYLITDFAN